MAVAATFGARIRIDFVEIVPDGKRDHLEMW